MITYFSGLYGQLGIGTNRKETLPQLVETLLDDSIYLIVCGAFETVTVIFLFCVWFQF